MGKENHSQGAVMEPDPIIVVVTLKKNYKGKPRFVMGFKLATTMGLPVSWGVHFAPLSPKYEVARRIINFYKMRYGDTIGMTLEVPVEVKDAYKLLPSLRGREIIDKILKDREKGLN